LKRVEEGENSFKIESERDERNYIYIEEERGMRESAQVTRKVMSVRKCLCQWSMFTSHCNLSLSPSRVLAMVLGTRQLSLPL